MYIIYQINIGDSFGGKILHKAKNTKVGKIVITENDAICKY